MGRLINSFVHSMIYEHLFLLLPFFHFFFCKIAATFSRECIYMIRLSGIDKLLFFWSKGLASKLNQPFRHLRAS
jgi:hypothetical protein